MTSESGSWPLLDERRPFAAPGYEHRRRRKLPRSAWVLTVLAFICGGLVSAAAFSIGWRHQAQRDTAARTALAAATAHTHRLEQRIAALQASLARARDAAASAAAAEKALARTGARVGADATATSGNATAISSGAGSLSAAATRIGNELKTLVTYLTTTPADQLDSGYISSQTAYVSRQLTRLQSDAGALGSSVARFEAGVRKLGADARALRTG
ncbi:MAG TPA: hypothetical protein VJV76_03415 [Gaiellaceae bacterium]|nr:hypothetical protein [Gaiellaceae bacterium]